MDTAPQLRHVEMPEPYGSRWVWEPEKRTQEFVVGDRTVAKSEFLAVVMTFRYLAHRVWELSLSEGRPFPSISVPSWSNWMKWRARPVPEQHH